MTCKGIVASGVSGSSIDTRVGGGSATDWH